jgi:hypothetical protein
LRIENGTNGAFPTETGAEVIAEPDKVDDVETVEVETVPDDDST